MEACRPGTLHLTGIFVISPDPCVSGQTLIWKSCVYLGFCPYPCFFCSPSRPLNATVCCLICRGMWRARGEGSTSPALAYWRWKTTEALWSPAGQAQSQALQLLLFQAPPPLFSAGWGPAEMGPPVGKGAQPFLPPLARWFARPLPLPGRRRPWGEKQREWDLFSLKSFPGLTFSSFCEC